MEENIAGLERQLGKLKVGTFELEPNLLELIETQCAANFCPRLLWWLTARTSTVPDSPRSAPSWQHREHHPGVTSGRKSSGVEYIFPTLLLSRRS
jgi:hypothetical protein